MNFDRGIGRTGLAVAAIVAIALCILSYIFNPVEISPFEYGICLPSPDTWGFHRFWSWIANTLLIAVIVLLMLLINKSYHFIRTTEPAYAAIFLIMATSGPWFTESLNSSVLICLANVVGMGIIFGSYDSRNATQQMFILGVIVGAGAMVQYGFLPMAIVYFLWALIMKVMRIKEMLAFGAGMICPYWIALGFGWLSFSDFHFPSLSPLFSYDRDPSEFFILLAGIALAAASGFIVTIINFMKLYAGNSRINAMNLCANILGLVAVVCILVDFDNMHAYVVTLYLSTAIQLSNICALWNPRKPWVVTAIPSVLYLALFVCSMIF